MFVFATLNRVFSPNCDIMYNCSNNRTGWQTMICDALRYMILKLPPYKL